MSHQYPWLAGEIVAFIALCIVYFKVSDMVLDTAASVIRITAVSHCYRAEAPRVDIDKALYRLHQFTKVCYVFYVCCSFSYCNDVIGRSYRLKQRAIKPQQ